jgi:hypothetical protein
MFPPTDTSCAGSGEVCVLPSSGNGASRRLPASSSCEQSHCLLLAMLLPGVLAVSVALAALPLTRIHTVSFPHLFRADDHSVQLSRLMPRIATGTGDISTSGRTSFSGAFVRYDAFCAAGRFQAGFCAEDISEYAGTFAHLLPLYYTIFIIKSKNTEKSPFGDFC